MRDAVHVHELLDTKVALLNVPLLLVRRNPHVSNGPFRGTAKAAHRWQLLDPAGLRARDTPGSGSSRFRAMARFKEVKLVDAECRCLLGSLEDSAGPAWDGSVIIRLKVGPVDSCVTP